MAVLHCDEIAIRIAQKELRLGGGKQLLFRHFRMVLGSREQPAVANGQHKYFSAEFRVARVAAQGLWFQLYCDVAQVSGGPMKRGSRIPCQPHPACHDRGAQKYGTAGRLHAADLPDSARSGRHCIQSMRAQRLRAR